MTALNLSLLKAGFENPVHDAQQSFRQLLDAIAHPGQISALPRAVMDSLNPPPGLSLALCATLLTLADYETAVWLHPKLRQAVIQDYLRFHCTCPLVDYVEQADFIVLNTLDEMPNWHAIKHGEPNYPDRSATLLIEVDSLQSSGHLLLRGPGIQTHRNIHIAGWNQAIMDFMHANQQFFPLGVDCFFTHQDQIMALPRTTHIEEQSCM